MQVDIVFDPVHERTTQVLTFTLKDEAGAVIPGANLTNLRFKLFARGQAAGIYVNGRDGTADLKSLVNAQGVATIELTPSDTTVTDTSLTRERLVLLFRWEYASATKAGVAVYELPLINHLNLP